MKLGARWKDTAGAKTVLIAWGISVIPAVLFLAVERGHLAALAWMGGCIALPILWNSKRRAVRVSAMATMMALGLFSLIAMTAIASDGRWDFRDIVAFALTAATSVATVLTLVVSWRSRGVDTSATETSAPLAAARSEDRPQAAQPAASAQAAQSPKIFISYRRADSQATTDRIFEHLVTEFRRENLFRDIDSVPKGLDFRQWTDRSVARCDVLLAIIGPQWLRSVDENSSLRLENPADFVRLEIEAALHRDIPVIPVTIVGARLPNAEELPESLREFAYRNGTTVRNDPDFVNDMRRLIADVRAAVAQTSPEAREPKVV